MRLHLKAITLRGFKSFASSTQLAFEPGITCVVGPNGSGKSNIVDALAWVMGEQGAKTLRGGKMEDVIFAGTSTKAPLGRAEVELTIDNSDGKLPIEYSEVTISRTLFRNGASEYAINGESCRLLDIQELLSDTGLGREMHVIVGQGQLDTVLRATPAERRAFIEEAAGILKFRRRKEKTERKLDSMQSNLIRLQDLIAEVRRNLKPLGRQAEVAKQAQEIAASVRELKSKLFAMQLRELRGSLEEISSDESQRKSEASYVQNQLQSTRDGISSLEASFSSEELDQERSELNSFERLESRIRNLSNLALQKLSLLEGAEESNNSAEMEQLEAQLAQLEKSLEELKQQAGAIDAELSTRTVSREQAAAELAAFDSEIEQKRNQQLELQRKRDQLGSAAANIDQSLKSIQSHREAIGTELNELAKRASELEQTQAELDPTGQNSSDDELRKAYERAKAQERDSRAALDAARDKLHGAERERDALAARHAALGLMLDQSDGARDVRGSDVGGIRGLLAESIEIDPGYQVAISAALGTIADAVAVESRSKAIAALRYLKDRKMGRADFLVVEGPSERGDDEAFAGLPVAASFVSAPATVRQLLDNFVVAQDIAEAESAAGPELAGKTIVTLEGDLVSPNLVRGGGTKQPSKLELAAERDAAAKSLEEFAKQIDGLSYRVEEAKSSVEQSSKLAAAALATLQQHDSELAARAERVGRVIAQLESLKSEDAKLNQELVDLAQRESSLGAEAADLATQLEQLPSEIGEDGQQDRESLAQALELARSAELESRVELGALNERRLGLERELNSATGRLAEARAASEIRAAQQAKRKQEAVNAQLAADSAPKLLEKVEALIASARSRVRELEAERATQTQRLQQLRSQALEFEQKLLNLNQGVHEVELRAHELRIQLSALEQRALDELSVGANELLEEFAEDDQERSELEKNLRTLESRLGQLGAFNPLALEEFAALEERHRYLSEQLEDLNKARADLRGIISDLDQKMQSTFLQAFEDTQREFEKIFPVLFPGGSGSISLTEPDNPLETGVEVAVKPAGKRIERMSLLSGGERSLAAVALLIAIFKARPSPFYVFDEVEAALDDANLGRLLDVIETLRGESQMIIVTHQKRTMEIADALYGVSMRQDGITQIVGQKLDKVG